MKAIGLWAPWALAIALGEKRVETRSRPTAYRGLLAIHATRTWNCEIADALVANPMRQILADAGYLFRRESSRASSIRGSGIALARPLPWGIVAVARLVDVVPTERFDHATPIVVGYDKWPTTLHELALGNYADGRYAWLLADVRRLARTVPIVGRQWLWTLNTETERAVREEIA